MSVLVVNAGGVTLDLTVVGDDDDVSANQQIDPCDGHDTQPIDDISTRSELTAVGHRIVHGG